jgi:Subtilase family
MSKVPGHMSVTQIWRLAAVLALALVAAALLCAGADAETAVTAQALADDGAFLPYAPPPSEPAGLCLVDTGVDLNPDTQSEVVERTAIDGGSGDDVSPESHGTVLAMMAGAPADGWGMVGTAPGAIRIVSVRILEPGQSTFPFSSYASGITACLEMRKRYDIKVINLSLGNAEEATGQDQEALANGVERAENYGVAVVAAAGNDDGGPVEYPAAYPLVLSVGASDAVGGALCAFSNRGAALRLTAPGCDLDGADPLTGAPNYNYWQGTSEASVIAASGLAALESYLPALSPQAAEEYLTGARAGEALDIGQAFRNAGLGQIVAAGEAAEPRAEPQHNSALTPAPESAPSGPTEPATRLPRPRVRFERLRGRVTLVFSGQPRGARAQVHFLGRRGRSRPLSVVRTLSGAFSMLRIPVRVLAVSVRYTDPYEIERDSAWTTLRVTRPARSGRGLRRRR